MKGLAAEVILVKTMSMFLAAEQRSGGRLLCVRSFLVGVATALFARTRAQCGSGITVVCVALRKNCCIHAPSRLYLSRSA